MVDAGGHYLQMVFKGEGAPAVVFDAGMAGGMRGWAQARDAVALRTRTVIFERAGFGQSEVGPAPRTARRVSKELHTALQTAGVTFPVVLVGHSAGGLFSVVFTSLFPADVAGLVLVDSATDDDYDHMRDSDPKFWANRSDPRLWEAEGQKAPRGWVGQMDALPRSVEEFRKALPLRLIPTVVLTALSPVEGEPGMSTTEDMQRWGRFQSRLLARIPGAEQVVFPKANHVSIMREKVLGERIIDVVARASRK